MPIFSLSLQQLVLFAVFLSVTVPVIGFAKKKPHIIEIVADDLGYNDLGCMNGGKTITPNIDSLIDSGVFLSSYYTFRVCAPSRAAGMTGRYPWGVGFYDMTHDSHHCVDSRFKMLPQLLHDVGYHTHAIGKWDVGYVEQHCTPTFRGFETFLGYYTACTSDYWYHGAPGGNATFSKCGGIDFHDSTEGHIRGASMNGPTSLNNTYDQEVFTRRAVDIIGAHNASEPLYLYLAYHNVHDACTQDRFALGLQAPLETVNRYSTTVLDTWKVQAAMTTELDYGVGNVTASLREAGMWNDTVLIFWSDNGGPLSHSSNFPFRAGKGSEFEGGYRTVAFVSSPLLPNIVRGTRYDGMMHSSDWYRTIIDVEGIAAVPLPSDTGPRSPDGHNMWPAIIGSNKTSPRTEVIHAVNNRYFNPSLGDVGVQAARFGDWKIILGILCDRQSVWQAWPTPSNTTTPFGLTNGTIETGTNHARAPLLETEPLTMSQAKDRICLFNLKHDVNETKNLATDPQYADLLAKLNATLRKRADTGPPLSIAFADVGPVNKTVDKQKCSQEEITGYLEPIDWQH